MVAAGALTTHDAYAALHDAGVATQQTHRDTHAAITGGFHAESAGHQRGRPMTRWDHTKKEAHCGSSPPT
jgi:hypothetical protein